MKNLILKPLMAAALAGLFAAQAQASVVIAGTRVIFPAQEREVTVKLTNDGKTPALVQSWLDRGNADEAPENIDVPFTLTPSMFRLEAGKGQTLRLIYSKEPLPQDKESLFWLNVLEVPPKATQADANHLQLAFRTRIKVMFRPQGLQGSVEEAPRQLAWKIVPGAGGKGYALQAHNPSAYVVNLGGIKLKSGGRTLDAGAGYVLPGASQSFPVAGLDSAPAAAEVDYSSIDDWGGTAPGHAPASFAPAS
ncbi:fimbrial biogenesis chaperone [Cupriavidus sp. 30B13]|uniref:fimbrial biogenesis chaperone n=1 Tax=Cupriavidus sp. 30B13 TaxID=3384241 RepID=UPI003B91A62C